MKPRKRARKPNPGELVANCALINRLLQQHYAKQVPQ
jgi:hypothetical protein